METETHERPVAPRSLLKIDYPEGFENGGRRRIEVCPEFSLLESETGAIEVESSRDIETHFWDEIFRLFERDGDTASTSKEERRAWALALVRLRDFTLSDDVFSDPIYGQASPIPFDRAARGRGGCCLAGRMAHTIGLKLAEISKLSDWDRIEMAYLDCAAQFKNAMRAFAVAKKIRLHGTDSKRLLAILHAERWVARNRTRPDKQSLRSEIEELGAEFRFKGNDGKGKWRGVFVSCGLGDLPESPLT